MTMFNTAVLRTWRQKKVRKLRRFSTNLRKSFKFQKKRNNRKNVSSDNTVSYGVERSLNIKIGITERTEDRKEVAVPYKDDELRFSQQYSLKLKVSTLYHVIIEVEASQEITYIVFGGKKYNTFYVSNEANEYGNKVYHFFWSTKGIVVTSRKHRSVLPCAVKLKKYKDITFDLQVKFYYRDEDEHLDGEDLSSINLGCQVGSGSSKETIINSIKIH